MVRINKQKKSKRDKVFINIRNRVKGITDLSENVKRVIDFILKNTYILFHAYSG